VGKCESNLRQSGPVSILRLSPSAQLPLARMPVNYISRDVRQSTVFYVILDIQIFFGQDLSEIIKSGKRPGGDYLVVDVRDWDFIGGNIPNCRNVPSATFSDKLDGLVCDTKDVPQVIFHCALSQQRCVTALIFMTLRV
jgi:rhodanese-related sulfurtransferase